MVAHILVNVPIGIVLYRMYCVGGRLTFGISMHMHMTNRLSCYSLNKLSFLLIDKKKKKNSLLMKL